MTDPTKPLQFLAVERAPGRREQRRYAVIDHNVEITPAKIRNGLLVHVEDWHTLDLKELGLEGAEVAIVPVSRWQSDE